MFSFPFVLLKQNDPHLRCRCALTVGKTNTEPGKIDEPRAKEQHFGKRQAEYKFYILQLTKVYFSKKQNHTSQMRMFKKKLFILQQRKYPQLPLPTTF